jgi:hypothetical protein
MNFKVNPPHVYISKEEIALHSTLERIIQVKSGKDKKQEKGKLGQRGRRKACRYEYKIILGGQNGWKLEGSFDDNRGWRNSSRGQTEAINLGHKFAGSENLPEVRCAGSLHLLE